MGEVVRHGSGKLGPLGLHPNQTHWFAFEIKHDTFLPTTLTFVDDAIKASLTIDDVCIGKNSLFQNNDSVPATVFDMVGMQQLWERFFGYRESGRKGQQISVRMTNVSLEKVVVEAVVDGEVT